MIHTHLAFLLTNPDGTPMTAMDLFIAGHEIMWPILLLSLVGLTAVVERLIFIFRENASRDEAVVEKMLERINARDYDGAVELGKTSNDYIARILVYALNHRDSSISNAFLHAASKELARFNQGLAVLDTVITAAPLLGLLGTVTGMMRTFGALNGGDIAAQAGSITGGVAEALIATMCGLGIAVLCLMPFNYLNARTEEARRDIEDASHSLEASLKRAETVS